MTALLKACRGVSPRMRFVWVLDEEGADFSYQTLYGCPKGPEPLKEAYAAIPQFVARVNFRKTSIASEAIAKAVKTKALKPTAEATQAPAKAHAKATKAQTTSKVGKIKK